MADEYMRLAYHGLRAKDKSFNARMISDFDPTMGKIKIVPQDMGRVLLNLINNAFYSVTQKQAKHPEEYEPMVTVSTRFRESLESSPIRQSSRSLVISVSDNGSGISQKALDQIFQPFYTTKPAGQGTGLGELLVETKLSEGSMFSIILPST